MAEDLIRIIWFAVVRAVFLALYERFGFWGTVALLLGMVAAVWVAVRLCGVLAHEFRLFATKLTKVVPAGESVPPFFGISYFDVPKKSCVCHVIPLNLLAGVAQAVRLRLKEGLGVKVGREHT